MKKIFAAYDTLILSFKILTKTSCLKSELFPIYCIVVLNYQ